MGVSKQKIPVELRKEFPVAFQQCFAEVKQVNSTMIAPGRDDYVKEIYLLLIG